MNALPDLHCHLDKFGDALPALAREWRQAGIGPVLTVGMDLESSRAAIEIARVHSTVAACIGLHPWEVGKACTNEEALAPYAELATDPTVRVISEVGLDAEVEASIETQKRVLRWFLRLAQQTGKPVVLHQKARRHDLLDVLDLRGGRPAAAIHGISGNLEDVQDYIAHGLFLSVGPPSVGMLGQPLATPEALAAIPEDRLMIDSDAFPAFGSWPEVRPIAVLEVAERLAEIRGVPVEHLASRVRENFERFVSAEL
jgi:TatD DNase family protein